MKVYQHFLRERWSGLTVALLGVGLFTGFLLYLEFQQYYQHEPLWLLPISVFIVVVLSGGLVYGGYWILSSAIPASNRWRISMWSLGGLTGAITMTFWPLFYQHAIGVTIEDPLFVLFVSGGIGANAGLLIGIYHAQSHHRREQLEDARDGLLFLNRSLRHNVLNSINVIDGFAARVTEESDSGATSQYVAVIRDRASRISYFVHNARILVQRLDGVREFELIDFSTLLQDEIQTFSQTYPDIEIQQDIEQDVSIIADELLAAAIENILVNIIEHASDPGEIPPLMTPYRATKWKRINPETASTTDSEDWPTITVQLSKTNSTAKLRIADDGPGIPADKINTIFEPGTSGESGLGLYLAKEVISDYEGTISLERNNPSGTAVILEIPRWEIH